MFKLLFSLFALTFGSETQLKNNLFQDYHPDVIPSNKLPIDLKLGIAFRSFNKIDHVEGNLESNIWLRYYWKDNFFKWKPSDYTNLTSLTVNTNPELDRSIWTPDIYLYNTAELPLSDLDYSRATVYNNGDVIWSRPGVIKSTCVFNLEKFPYDKQTCKFKFGSWVYHGNQINLTTYKLPVDKSNLQKNVEWNLLETKNYVEVKRYGCCPDPYPSVTFEITLERKYGYYTLNIIIPTFATSALMVISMLIPWDSGERISFAATVMLSIIVFLLILSENLPRSNDKPLLSVMLIGLMFFSLAVVFLTVLITAMRNIKNGNKVGTILVKYYRKYIKNKKCSNNRVDAIRPRTISYSEAVLSSSIEEDCSNISDYIENTSTVVFIVVFAIYCFSITSLQP